MDASDPGPGTTEGPGAEAGEAERTARVVERVARSADPSGFVGFDRFMEVALYDPEVGFYARPRSPFGGTGDFYTAPHVHPIFGRTLARRVAQVRAALPRGRPFRLVEIGPGDGSLSALLIDGLGAERTFAEGDAVLLVERSAARATAATQAVRPSAERHGLSVRLAESVGADGPFSGVVVANEVMDAQPTRRLRWSGEHWTELGVRVSDGRLVPAESSRARPVPSPELPHPVEPGTVVEVAPAAESMVREVGDHLVEGELILFDYGMEEPELVRGHPLGTLAAVRGHREARDPLEAPGRADLSAFVNFTRLRAVARRAGLEPISDRRQAESLVEWGLSAEVERSVREGGSPEAEVKVRLAAKNLLFGFERFRALEFAPRPVTS